MYLKRDPKSGVYKYRREYPAGLRSAIGRTNFIKSLETADRKEADKCLPEAQREYDEVVEHYKLLRYTIPPELKIPLTHELTAHYLLVRGKDLTLLELQEIRSKMQERLRSYYGKLQEDGEDVTIFSHASKGKQQPVKQMVEVYEDLLLRMENARRITMKEPTLSQAEFEAGLPQQLDVASAIGVIRQCGYAQCSSAAATRRSAQSTRII